MLRRTDIAFCTFVLRLIYWDFANHFCYKFRNACCHFALSVVFRFNPSCTWHGQESYPKNQQRGAVLLALVAFGLAVNRFDAFYELQTCEGGRWKEDRIVGPWFDVKIKWTYQHEFGWEEQLMNQYHWWFQSIEAWRIHRSRKATR